MMTLTLLTALSVLTLNMILPSLPSMARDLVAREAVVTLALSGYMLSSALFQLTLGPMSDRFGRRRVMLSALGIYVIASLGCALATEINTLLVFRVLQAVIVAGAVVSSATIRDQYSARESAGKLGAIASAMAIAPMLGPVLGGFLDGALGWRSVFWLYTTFGAALLILAWNDMGETRPTSLPAPRWADWKALLGSARYWAYVLCVAFSVGAFYVFITGVPLVSTQSWRFTPTQIGLGVGSITGGFLLGAAVTARLAPRRGIVSLILFGRLISTVVLLLALVLFVGGATHPLLLFGLTVFVGFGNGLTIPNANAGALTVRPDLAGTAAGLGGALAIALGALLSGITALVLDRSATPAALVSMMIVCVLLSFAAALLAIRLDRSEQLQ